MYAKRLMSFLSLLKRQSRFYKFTRLVESLLIKIPFAKQYGSEELLQVDEWNTFTGEVMREY